MFYFFSDQSKTKGILKQGNNEHIYKPCYAKLYFMYMTCMHIFTFLVNIKTRDLVDFNIRWFVFPQSTDVWGGKKQIICNNSFRWWTYLVHTYKSKYDKEINIGFYFYLFVDKVMDPWHKTSLLTTGSMWVVNATLNTLAFLRLTSHSPKNYIKIIILLSYNNGENSISHLLF